MAAELDYKWHCTALLQEQNLVYDEIKMKDNSYITNKYVVKEIVLYIRALNQFIPWFVLRLV